MAPQADARADVHDNIRMHYTRYVNSPSLADVRFVVGRDETVMHAHRVMLAGASELFRVLFDPDPDGFAPAGDAVRVPQFEPDVFLAVLRYVYDSASHCATPCSMLRKLTADGVTNVSQAADYYALSDLVEHCARHLRDALLNGDDNAIDLLRGRPDAPWAAPLRDRLLTDARRHCPKRTPAQTTRGDGQMQYARYANSPRLADVRFVVGRDETVMHGHRVMLAGASAVFRGLLDLGADGVATTDTTLYVPQFEPDAFLAVLRHAYDRASLGDALRGLTAADAVNMTRAADYYALTDLVKHCAHRLRDALLNDDNAVYVLLGLPDAPWAAPLRDAALLYVASCGKPLRGAERLPYRDVGDALRWTARMDLGTGTGMATRLAMLELACACIDARKVPKGETALWRKLLTRALPDRDRAGLAAIASNRFMSRERLSDWRKRPTVEFCASLCDTLRRARPSK